MGLKMLLTVAYIFLDKIKVLSTSTVPRKVFFTTPTTVTQTDRTPPFVQGLIIAMVVITVILIIILIFLAYKLWRSGLMQFGKHRNIYETPDIPLDTHGSEFAANYETNFGPQYENVSGPTSQTNNTIVVDNRFAKALIDSRYEVREVEEEEEQEQGSVREGQDEVGTEYEEIGPAVSANGENQDSQSEVESVIFSHEETSEI